MFLGGATILTIYGVYKTSSSRLFASQQVFSSNSKKAPENWADIRKRYGLPDKPAEATDPLITSKILQALNDAETNHEKALKDAEAEHKKEGGTEVGSSSNLPPRSTILPLLMVIKDLGEDDVPQDVRRASTRAMERLISDQEDIVDAFRKEFALATARRIEDCKRIEEDFKVITEEYLIQRAGRKEMEGILPVEDGAGWEKILLVFQDKCRATQRKLEEVEARLKKPRQRLDRRPGYLDDLAGDEDVADARAMDEAVDALQELEFVGTYILENMPKAN